MSSSWLKSVGNPLKTTFNCLLWAISNVWDRNFLSDIIFVSICALQQKPGKLRFPVSKPLEWCVARTFLTGQRSSVALLCESITMGAIFVESVAKRGQRKKSIPTKQPRFPIRFLVPLKSICFLFVRERLLQRSRKPPV
ncbi:hypothetical protein TNCV_4004671 [Trichonephila clavipes]|nr:hypothetical protein TNCV_4004671 [Trichonephila clavipes]